MSLIDDVLNRARGVLAPRNDIALEVTPDAAPVDTAARGDAWQSAQTGGIGNSLTDAAFNSLVYRFGADITLNPQLIRKLMRKDPISRKVISKQVDLAFGSGLEWASGDLELLQSELIRLDLIKKLQRARRLGRAFGGALLIANVQGSGLSDEPLRLDAPNLRLLHLRTVDRWSIINIELHQGGEMDGEPEYYTIQSYGSGRSVRMHYTRCYRFEGLDVDDQTRVTLQGWGDSVLQPVFETLRDASVGFNALNRQLKDSVQPVYHIKGLNQAIRAGNSDFIKNWIGSIERFRSALRAIVLDADNEKFGYVARAMGDSTKVHGQLLYMVAAAADMPMTELYGTAPEGFNSSGDAQLRKFYDKIEAEEREGDLGNGLEWLVEILRVSLNTDITYTWPSLWSPTAEETARLEQLNAQTDQIYVNMGVTTPEEVREHRQLTLGFE